MTKEELIGKLQMVYVGDKNALNELIGYYDGLKQGIEIVQQENKELKNKIKELIKYGYGTDMSLGEFKGFYKLATGKNYDPKNCPEVK